MRSGNLAAKSLRVSTARESSGLNESLTFCCFEKIQLRMPFLADSEKILTQNQKNIRDTLRGKVGVGGGEPERTIKWEDIK